MRYRVVKPYTDAPVHPISIKKGEQLEIIKVSDPAGDWANWIYCKGLEKEGWVPKQILRISANQAISLEDYSAREHNLRMGEVIITHRELNGWIWGVKESEREIPGWAPLNCLERMDRGNSIN